MLLSATPCIVNSTLPDTTRYSASFFAVDMITRTELLDTILLNKVGLVFVSYIATQYFAPSVSHHPPISAYYYISPKNNLIISGEIKPSSRFLGNSVSTVMGGENRVFLSKRPEDGGELKRHDAR